MEIFFLVLSCILGFVNLIILVGLAIFLVRLREFVKDVISVMTGMDDEDDDEYEDDDVEPAVPANSLSSRPKTWDEKYEEELDAVQRRMREERGQSSLVDLK